VPEGDLSRDRAKRFPSMKIYPTIAEALTLALQKKSAMPPSKDNEGYATRVL
jgi:hypothetical protein